MSNFSVLGIDIGSISIGIAAVSDDGTIKQSSYCNHNGEIATVLKKELNNYAVESFSSIAYTSSSVNMFNHGHYHDSTVSIITAVKKMHPDVSSVLHVGGENFSLIRFNSQGEYQDYKTNSSCAAGTGSFLDQQAKRLNLKSIQEFCDLACANQNDIPHIASRCAVFAKTDLIHAQQEGFSLEQICDGLSRGLAKNICDSLFDNLDTDTFLFVGGVSLNRAVLQHIETLTKRTIFTDKLSHLYGAIGTALSELEYLKQGGVAAAVLSANDIVSDAKLEKKYHYPALETEIGSYPDFQNMKSYLFHSEVHSQTTDVEVDLYQQLSSGIREVYLGIDIGSTSTKATLIGSTGLVLAGFYTRTSGKPVIALQTIFEAIDNLSKKYALTFDIQAAGTTGSGRKFIGTIINADLILDEISAHARAAVEIDPEVDTIIEIGGQDAKFTTLQDGSVTFSVMNNVCAAGTGSFIEEQAQKLGCPLDQYAQRAGSSAAPLSSDRCTVFMERDLNYYLNSGYSNAEILTAVLHSVRENYLTKVAVPRYIGKKIFFQGATAKNRALVAAFQQKLGKEIVVSKYCHLTGALGVALELKDRNSKLAKISNKETKQVEPSVKQASSFTGINIYTDKVIIKNEVCTICTNHCKIRVAELNNKVSAFGFLCGRDYQTNSYVANSDRGYELLKERNAIFKVTALSDAIKSPTIGIPAALHIFEELPLWLYFFKQLGLKTITSNSFKQGVAKGKKIAGAEFCAPISNLYGHVDYLIDRCDYIFLPNYLEEKQKESKYRRHYCYYTQFIPVIIKNLDSFNKKNSILSPTIKSLQGNISLKAQLYSMIRSIAGCDSSLFQISAAFDQAQLFYSDKMHALKQSFLNNVDSEDINIVLLGRPYTTLVPAMNNGIVNIFESLGVKTFYQDMIQTNSERVDSIDDLLQALHWNYGAKILECAATIADEKNLYPVLVTSFKCTPDSFVMEYYKSICEAHNKPYLILQLDEHDSSVGYETRIESAIRSFRNNFQNNKKSMEWSPLSNNLVSVSKDKDIFKDKILLLPCWDMITTPLMQAQLINAGIDARLLDESEESIQKSLHTNTGQCIPLNVIAQNVIDYVYTYKLDPRDCVLWMFDSSISCNIRMYPYYLKRLLEQQEQGMENIAVYIGEITFTDISYMTAINIYFAYMFGGLIRKMGCKIRPYEVIKGKTDAAISKSVLILFNMFKEGSSKDDALRLVIDLFKNIEQKHEIRPKVALFGDLYVRDNDIMNQGLIQFIERNGGEVVTTPYNEYLKLIASPYLRKWVSEGKYADAAVGKIITTAVTMIEKKYYKYFNEILGESADDDYDTGALFTKYHMSMQHSGESMDNILKICSIAEKHPDLTLFVQTNPAYCCPSLVTEAMSERLEKDTGIPIVTIEYDGTGGNKNDVLVPFLKFPRKLVKEV